MWKEKGHSNIRLNAVMMDSFWKRVCGMDTKELENDEQYIDVVIYV